MTLYEKLLIMQTSVDAVIKDGKNSSDKYDFASDENVLDTFRPMMDELKLLLIPKVRAAQVLEGQTRSGTARYLTEMTVDMQWVDVETGETLEVPWYAQGVDLAGEKGVGKALTYAEKYFLLKFFHVPTKKDDPDSDGRTGSGEKKQSAQAKKELVQYHRAAVVQMFDELYAGDAEKIKAGYVALTKSDARGYAGVDSIDKVSDAALVVLYAKLKKNYEARLKKKFELKSEEE